MFEKLCALIAEQFGVEPETVTAETAFVDDLGADSVDLVDLDEMAEDDLTTIVTVGDLYKYMQEHLDD